MDWYIGKRLSTTNLQKKKGKKETLLRA